jgi:AcrR family transcriptional regulator
MARPAPRKLEWVRPPRQARSAETLERILDAAEALVVEAGIERLTVSEVARRAGSSVGAFYARFPDKEALLRCLFERFHEQGLATADAALAPERWRGIALADVLRATIGFMVAIVRERGRILAGMARRTDPEVRAMSRALAEHLGTRVLAFLAARGERLRHPEPELAVRVAVFTVLSVLQSRAMLLDADGPPVLPDELVARELGRMCTSYLQVEE